MRLQESTLFVPMATRMNFWAAKFISFVAFEHENMPNDVVVSVVLRVRSKASNEMNFLAGKFARQVMGSNNIDSCNRT